MIDYAGKELFLMDNVDKQLHITYDGGVISNSELASEDFSLTEKLTSKGDLVFGDCNSSYIEFSVGYGAVPLEGKKLTVSITPKGAGPFKIGEYTVISDKPTADRRWRKITAYDAMYDLINADVTEWFDSVLPEPDPDSEPVAVTLREFRDGFFEYLGIDQEEVSLPNDAVVLTRMASFKQLSGKAVASAICEINGCFGHVDRDGVFRYVFLHSPSEPMYPAYNLFPAHDLYPKAAGCPIEIGLQHRYVYPLPKILYPSNELFPGESLYPVAYETETIDGAYISANYEDFFVNRITAIQIRNSTNDIGVTVGSGTTYIVEGNFLAYGQTEEALEEIAGNILEQVTGVYYCPADIEAQGNPCLQVGDPIILHTRYAVIETIILNRKLKGIQFLIDGYSAKGQKELKSNLNGTSKALANANGKINEVKADLITATKLIADEIEAESARIGYLEADHVTVAELTAVDGKIDNLSAIAITTQNLSAQSINANQINAGTISVTYLDVAGIVSSLSAQSITVAGLSVTGAADLGGYETYWVYDSDLGQYVLCGTPL